MEQETFTIKGNIVDIVNRQIFKGTIQVKNKKIESIKKEEVKENQFILPGFIDSHIHIESSMLIPSEFSKIAVKHGTVGVVTDPHEIANVLGMKGIEFMIKNSKKAKLKIYFGAPSCVPATCFESSGAIIDSKDINKLLSKKEIICLSEMMNFPGVIHKDKEILKKIDAAKKHHKVVDGHAPGLTGKNAKKYIDAGISTDHECSTLEEAQEKIKYGMKILIRQGSAAKNFDNLIPLIKKYPNQIMFCSDDKHPDDLIKGHINLLVKKAIKEKYDLMDVLRAATLNPIKHYGLNVGLIQKGDKADFIVVDNLANFRVLKTYVDGEEIIEEKINRISKEKPINNFLAKKILQKDIEVKDLGKKIKVIKAIDKQLLTKTMIVSPKIKNGQIVSDNKKDVLKIVVLNRYKKSKPSIAFINGFKLKKGAIASSIAHDSHNIVAVGENDKDIIDAINRVIENRGGLAYATNGKINSLRLPFAGLMTNEDGNKTAKKYQELDLIVRKFGTKLHAPFMTLSFMALLVIPQLKISDKGLFDVEKFSFTKLTV
ncbi:MAG: adenine deaminase [Candidatus ainarchaeum sp.]|nr:adenine deaminase [Candidatus ainarchaeum sp.]